MDYFNLNEEKAKKLGAQIVKGISSTVPKQKDLKCYQFFQGLYREDDFSYLTSIADKNEKGEEISYALPAKMRFIPIIRPKINRLISTFVLSPLSYKVYACDQVTLKKKVDKRIKEYVNMVDMRIRETIIGLQSAQQQLQQQQQQLQEMLSKEPESEQEQQQIAQIKQQLPMIEQQIAQMNMIFERGLIMSEDDLDSIEKAADYDADEIVEVLSQKILNKALDSEGIFNEAKKGITDKIVTGKVQYLVMKEKNIKKPVFRCVNSLSAYYSADDDVENIEQARWCALKERKTAAQILNDYRFDKIPAELSNRLKAGTVGTGTSNDTFLPVDPGKAVDMQGTSVESVSNYSGTSIEPYYDVYRIFYRGQRHVNVKKVPNGYMPGKYYRKYITEEEVEGWERSREKNEAKGEKLNRYPIEDIWDIVVVDSKHVVRAEKLIYQCRDENYQVQLPLVGEAFNSLYKAPYSMIWASKDIQILYNLVNYHAELMLALAGTKGTFMDDSYRPTGMSRKQWMYMKKLGTAWIEGGKLPGQGKRPSNFAHWGANYDDTLSQAIQYLEGIKRNLEESASIVTGVTRESMGQTVPSDQVGTYQMSNQNASLVTHVIYWEHDQVLRRALAKYVNLCVVSQDEDSYLSLVNQDFEQDIINIKPSMFKGVRLDVYLKNSNDEHLQMNTLKQLIGSAWSAGQLPFESIPKLYGINTVKELEVSLTHMAEKAQKIASLNAQNSEKAKAQAAIEIKRFEKEFDKIVEDQKRQIEQQKVELDGARVRLEEMKMKLEHEAKQKATDVKLIDVASEREIEMAMIEEQNRSNISNEKLKELEIKINAILTAIQTDGNQKVAVSKMNLEREKTKNVGKKEHINNN